MGRGWWRKIEGSERRDVSNFILDVIGHKAKRELDLKLCKESHYVVLPEYEADS